MFLFFKVCKAIKALVCENAEFFEDGWSNLKNDHGESELKKSGLDLRSGSTSLRLWVRGSFISNAKHDHSFLVLTQVI